MTGALPGIALPPDPGSPGLARRHVRAVLHDAGLGRLQDDALVLVSELVTNAVVHAGTGVELQVRAEPGGLWLQVTDHLPGAVPAVLPGDDDAEGGRGLFLLDALAAEWGTTHRRDGKAVWFRLQEPAPSRPAPPPSALSYQSARGEPPRTALSYESAGEEAPRTALTYQSAEGGAGGAPDLAWVLELPADLEQRLPVRLVLRELLDRLCDALDVDAAAVLAVLEPGSPAVQVTTRGSGLTEAQVARAGRAPREPARVVEADGLLVLPLSARHGPVGALVLCPTGPVALVGPQQRAVARLVADRMALLLADQVLEQQRQRDRGALALLAEAGELFAESLDVRLAAALTTHLVVPRFGTCAALFTLHERGARLDAVSCADETRTAELREALSSPAGRALADDLAGRLQSRQPVVVEPVPALAQVARHLLAVPLVARRRLLGVLLVGRGDRPHSPPETSLLLDLARRAALAGDTARLYEDSRAVAGALQASLLPASLPSSPAVDFAARYTAAGEGNQVGGDFYDVFGLPGGAFGVAIGDVCGKGPEAAAITGLARQVLRLSLRDGHGLSASFTRLNDALLELGERGRFLTGALAVVRPDAGRLRVLLCSAGHPLPLLVRPPGTVRPVGRAGDLVGVLPAVGVHEDEVVLHPGDSLVLFTDGVTERREGNRQFGDRALAEVLARCAGADAATLAARVEEGVHAFSAQPARDDLAVLVVQARTTPSPPVPPPSRQRRRAPAA